MSKQSRAKITLPLTSTGQNEERASSTYTAPRQAPIDGGDGRNYCTTCHRTNVSFEKGCSAADRVHTNAKCCLRANICKCSPSGPPRVWFVAGVAGNYGKANVSPYLLGLLVPSPVPSSSRGESVTSREMGICISKELNALQSLNRTLSIFFKRFQ